LFQSEKAAGRSVRQKNAVTKCLNWRVAAENWNAAHPFRRLAK
jgi:hypothetical protein